MSHHPSISTLIQSLRQRTLLMWEQLQQQLQLMWTMESTQSSLTSFRRAMTTSFQQSGLKEMFNDARMGWIVAAATVGFSLFSGTIDIGRSDQKVTVLEKQVNTIQVQQATHTETIAKMQTQFLDVERRLNAADRQLQSVNTLDSRLARIEVTVELIGRQLGAPIPSRSGP